METARVRRGRVKLALALVATSALACSSTARPPGEARPTVPRFGQIVSAGPDAAGLLTLARPSRGRIPSGEPVRLLIHFERPGGPLGADDPVARRDLLLEATTGSLVLEVQRRGETVTLRTRPRPPAPPPPAPASQPAVLEPDEVPPVVAPPARLHPVPTLQLVLRQRELAVQHEREHVRLQLQPALELDRPGDLLLRVSGELVFADGKVPFSTGQIPLRLVPISPSFLATRPLYLKLVRELKADYGYMPPVELPGGNLLCRLSGRLVGDSMDSEKLEVVATPSGRVIELRAGTSHYCVAAGTPVATRGGERAVQELRPGDRVWAYDTERRERHLVRVLVNRRARADRLVRLGRLRVTARHPVLANGRWTRAGALAPGDSLLRGDLSPVVVERTEIIAGPADVFALTVDWPHTYFAGGVLVHNKSVRYVPFDPWIEWYERLPPDTKRPNPTLR